MSEGDQKFFIYDKVCPVEPDGKDGPVCVIDIVYSMDMFLAQCNSYNWIDTWVKMYGSLDNAPVYVIRLPEPRKNLTFDELREQRPNDTEYELMERWERIPLSTHVSVPQQALVLHERYVKNDNYATKS